MNGMHDKVLKLIGDGLSHREIQKIVGVSLSTISSVRNKRSSESRVLVIGDIHEPCCRKGYMEFCQRIAKEYHTNKTVFIGDVVDWTGISFHAAHPEAPGPSDEYEAALGCIRRWYDAFPRATVCIGNHDARVIRLAEDARIPAKFLRDFKDIWHTPKWEWVDEKIIDDVYYFHGTGRGGIHPAYNVAKDLGMSCVMGHIHSVAGVKWLVSPSRRWFGMDTGCGIDDKSYAFAYGKHMKRRSVISCGTVMKDSVQVHLMPLEDYK